MRTPHDDDRQYWLWRFVLPPAVVMLTALWPAVMLGRMQQASGKPLYALFAHTDSAGTGEIFWKKDGERQAFAAVVLPYCVGLTLLLAATGIGSIGMRRNAGWLAVLGFWIYGGICGLVLSGIFGWLWINVTGVFI